LDPIAHFADVVAHKLGIHDSPLETTRSAHLDDVRLLGEFAARSLDLMALPTALATNVRLLEGEVEIPKQRWSTSRIGDGQVIHTELLNPEIDRALLQGGMVVIDSIDEVDLALMRLRESLEYRLSARAWINLYMTAASTSNFGLHYDTCDTLIVQLLGRKLWMVGDQSQPLGAVIDSTDRHDLRRVELTPGDLLGMPARALHNATGLGVFTMHLTIGFDRSAALPHMVEEVDTVLGQTRVPLTDTDLELAKARVNERRLGTSLPFAEVGEGAVYTLIRWATRLRPVSYVEPDGTLQIISGLNELTFSGADAEVVRVLVVGDEYSFDELAAAADVPTEDASRVVRELAARDLVICRFSGCYP
jgi:Uncharacterized conserved protein